MIPVTPRRAGRRADRGGDPLDGLVNLFDIGLVLAVAFLLAGLGLAMEDDGRTRAVPPPPAAGPEAAGRGEEVGKVYRLPDGRLVLVAP